MTKMSARSFRLALSGQRAPVDYDRAPLDHGVRADKDVRVRMRDSVTIAVDVYRPETADRYPALLAFSIHNKDLEIMATANQFKRGHRICVEITSLDIATGVGSATNVEYIPYHICSSKTVLHRIFHDPKHPSHLLLPVIPDRANPAPASLTNA
jgi:predicted acyl esterase